MTDLINWIDPKSIEGLTHIEGVFAISFKEWVDNKYGDTNLIVKYSSPLEQEEFLHYVMSLADEYDVAIIPEFEQNYSPEFDVTQLKVAGHISGEFYYEGPLRISAKDFISMFIETELLTGEVNLNAINLTSIIS